MGCACIGYLMEIGAVHAAAMHADPNRNWTPEDYHKHHQEERELLWPRFMAHHVFFLHNMAGAIEPVYGWQLVVKFDKEHLAFEAELRDNGTITNTALLDAHSRLENELILQMRNES